MTDGKIVAEPCPCCGGWAVVRKFRGVPVYCTRCSLSGPWSGDGSDVARWNRRSSASGSVSVPSTSMSSRPCPCCGQLRRDPYTIRHEGLSLRKCPFCGGRPHVSVSVRDTYVTFRIECRDCHAGGRYVNTGFEDDPEPILKIAELWNRRTSDSGEASE